MTTARELHDDVSQERHAGAYHGQRSNEYQEKRKARYPEDTGPFFLILVLQVSIILAHEIE